MTPAKLAGRGAVVFTMRLAGFIAALAALAGLMSGPGPQSAEAAMLVEVKKLIASDAQDSDFFGWSVAVSGETAAVGVRLEDAGGSDAGAAYVFQRNQGGTDNWGEVKKLTASDAQVADYFGGSVSVSGDTAVVGAYVEDAAGSNAGAAYVFQRDQGGVDNWGEVKKLAASDAQATDEFGGSVSVSGDTAVVGARFEDAGGIDAGAAYLFQRNQGGTDNWGEVKKLTASDAQADDLFGHSVAVSGDAAVVGAFGEDAGGSNVGAAYVFHRNQGGTDNWGEVKKLTASDIEAGDEFGWSVAVGGDDVVVGAHAEDAGGSNAGSAYVFQSDADEDGVPDATDNCPDTVNPMQQNMIHLGGPGDHCDDPEPDNVYDIDDNCPDIANAGQENDDGDAFGDACDNCPTVATPWVVPPGDSDCDYFTDAEEALIGTDDADPCGFVAGGMTPSETWPPDLNPTNKIDILDILQFKLVFGSPSARHDLNVSGGAIDILDVLQTKPVFNEECKP